MEAPQSSDEDRQVATVGGDTCLAVGQVLPSTLQPSPNGYSSSPPSPASVNSHAASQHSDQMSAPPQAMNGASVSMSGIPQPNPSSILGLSSFRANLHPVSADSTLRSSPAAAPLGRPPSSKRQIPTYKMSDGSVVSGKGLGRGRPGIKRGPRQSKLSNEITIDSDRDTDRSTPLSSPQNTPAPTMQGPDLLNGVTNGSIKRKRAGSNLSRGSNENQIESRSSTPEYNPQSSQTRSGRQSQRPSTILSLGTPTKNASDTVSNGISPTTSPSSKKPRGTETFAKPHTPITHPKIKRKIYRGRESLALCEHCLRGNGPAGNVIVFCDACNHCWHQKCHDPPIAKETVADKHAEWFCASCDDILHPEKRKARSGSKTGKQKGRKTSQSGDGTGLVVEIQTTKLPINTLNTHSPSTLVPANLLSREQRLSYLNSLTKAQLTDLLMRATDLAPEIPIFPRGPTETPKTTVPIFSRTPETPKTDSKTQSMDNEQDWEYELDEIAALYPKPGNGVRLPPESADLHMLLEGPECRTFSHWKGAWGQPGPLGGPISASPVVAATGA